MMFEAGGVFEGFVTPTFEGVRGQYLFLYVAWKNLPRWRWDIWLLYESRTRKKNPFQRNVAVLTGFKAGSDLNGPKILAGAYRPL